MKHLHISLIIAALALSASLGYAQEITLTQMTADQLVAKNLEAKGGQQALRALQSLKMSGKLVVNQGQLAFGYTEIRKRPNDVRLEFSLQGMTAVNAFDGNEGWKISPFQGRKDPEKMSADDVK